VQAYARKASVYGQDLKLRRSLIAATDPFIVIPQTWAGRGDEGFIMQVGDFVAVIHAGKVYPCIIGDTGPTTKTGEGSTRLARALNPKASGKMSAVTTPAVTYLVFPGTRLPMGAPDLAAYRSKVAELLKDFGGPVPETALHTWK
jgi:hypothetical protein